MEPKTEGKHRGHNVVPLEEANAFIRETLDASVKTMESEIPSLEEATDKTIEKMGEIQLKKDKAKEFVQDYFVKLRELLNTKETEVMTAIEKSQLGEELEQFLSDAQGAFDEISSGLEGGKALLDSWDNGGSNSKMEVTPEVIQTVASAVERAKEIRSLMGTYKEACGYEVITNPKNFEDGVKNAIQSISKVGNVEFEMVLVIGPKELQAKDVGPFFVSLEWGKQSGDEKYTIAVQKEGSDCAYLESKENGITLASLEQDTTYKFSVRAQRGAIMSEWSDPLEVKTLVPTIEASLSALNRHCENEEICAKSLDQMKSLIVECKKKINIEMNINNFIYLFYYIFYS